MTVIEHLATAGVGPGEQLRFWNRVASETFCGLAVDGPSESFQAEMWRWSLGALTMIRPRSPAAVVHSNAEARSSRKDQVILHLQHRGRSLHSQFGRSNELHSGDMALCASGADYRLDLSDANDMLVVEMPRALLQLRTPDLDAKLAHRIPGTTPGARLLHDFVLSLWQQGVHGATDPDWQDGIVDVFLDLLGLALRDPKGAVPVRNRPNQKLLAIVEAQLGDPDLRTATLADALNVSTRSIQNMFAAMGATPSGYILERRLDRAADRLAADANVSITAVAFDLGFNDSAYFARCFRQRFGTAPRLYRARH
jgi:AraC-like DNA-binding protein